MRVWRLTSEKATGFRGQVRLGNPGPSHAYGTLQDPVLNGKLRE